MRSLAPRLLFCTFIAASLTATLTAQPRPNTTPPAATTPATERPAAHSRILNIDSSVSTHAEVTTKGHRAPSDATAGTIPVWDEDGKPIAGVFYTYYERSDIKDRDSRPLVISFNGGPGTPSVWMEI